MKLIFNFNKKTPSSILLGNLKIFFLVFLLFPLAAFSQPKNFEYHDETFTLLLNSSKVLFLYGPWGEDPVVVDRHVREGWGTAASFGVAVVYQKRDELRWAVLNREDGKKLAGAILKNLEPEDGEIDYVSITAQDSAALVKVVFDTGDFTVYRFDKYGRQKVVREGKLGRR